MCVAGLQPKGCGPLGILQELGWGPCARPGPSPSSTFSVRAWRYGEGCGGILPGKGDRDIRLQLLIRVPEPKNNVRFANTQALNINKERVTARQTVSKCQYYCQW